jgi:hypothetical protein
MAAARLDLASVFLYAGSIAPGWVQLSDGTVKDNVTIIDAFEAVGACARGLMSMDDVDRIERAICPGEGACGGMYTANTMASVAEAMGMSVPGSAAPPPASLEHLFESSHGRRQPQGQGRTAEARWPCRPQAMRCRAQTRRRRRSAATHGLRTWLTGRTGYG